MARRYFGQVINRRLDDVQAELKIGGYYPAEFSTDWKEIAVAYWPIQRIDEAKQWVMAEVRLLPKTESRPAARLRVICPQCRTNVPFGRFHQHYLTHKCHANSGSAPRRKGA
jgi:hypothetical protein